MMKWCVLHFGHSPPPPQVSQTSINNVLRREAYLLFYIRDHEHMPLANGGPQAIKPGATTAQGVKGVWVCGCVEWS